MSEEVLLLLINILSFDQSVPNRARAYEVTQLVTTTKLAFLPWHS